jgi:hypothetical protein
MAKQDKVKVDEPTGDEPGKDAKPDKKDKVRKQCPTCKSILRNGKAAELTDVLDETTEDSMQAAAITLPFKLLDVTDTEYVYGERNNYEPEGTFDFPWWIVDRWTNGTNIYDRLSVYFDPSQGEAILVDLNLMLAALPNESPRKATFAYIVDRVTQVMYVWNNPPEEPPIEEPPPTPPGFPGLG